MQPGVSDVSLAELTAAGIHLGAGQAVTLVRELLRLVAQGAAPGVPSAHVIRLSSTGAISIEGPVDAGGRDVPRAAVLLEALLPVFGVSGGPRVPGALRLVIARALGTLDLPAYPSLDAFADALLRFADSEPPDIVVGDVVSRWSAAKRSEPVREPAGAVAVFQASDEELTVSDIRRARRATGLTLSEIAVRSRIPVSLLRELEWGYLRNWPTGHYGRTQMIRYARAAGLDELVVVRTVWPLLQEAADAFGHVLVSVEPAEPPTVDNTQESTALAAFPRTPQSSWRGRRLLAALAIPALVALAIAPAIWQRPSSGATPAVSGRPAGSTGDGSAAETARAAEASTTAERPAPPIAAPRAALRAQKTGGSDGPRPATTPALASVGSATFYHEEVGTSGATLRVTRVVNDRAHNFHARPSPDGTRIAFDSDREGERAVFVADADGQRVRRISGPGFAAVPSWSPGGHTLAFVRAEPDRPRVWNLWTVDLETRRMRQLTSHQVGQPGGGSWFPDGKRIAYSHEARLVVLNVETGRDRVFPSPVKGRVVRTPAVSPDGQRVIFHVDRDGGWMLELADDSMRKVLSDDTVDEYAWAPDGRRVAYHSRRSGDWGVWIMAPR